MKDIGQRESRFATTLFLALLGVVTLLVLRMMLVYVTPIVLALVLASLFWPLFERARARVNGRRAVAAGICTAVVVVVVIVPLILVATSLSAEVIDLYEKTSSNDRLLAQFRGLLSGESALVERVREQAARVNVDLSQEKLSELAAAVGKAIGVFLYGQIGGIASNALALLLHFGMMLVFLFAFFADGPRLKAYLLDLSPLPDEEEELIAAKFRSISRAVFLGNGVASISQGVIAGISFYVFGIGSGILWGSAIAFFAFLPMVGASIVVVPAALYLLLTGKTGLAVGFLLFNAVQVFVFENVVKTRLMSGSGPDQLNAVLVFFGVVAGLSVFGLMGLFYGPLVVTMFLTLAEIYKEHYRDHLLGLTRRPRDPPPPPPTVVDDVAAVPPPAGPPATAPVDG